MIGKALLALALFASVQAVHVGLQAENTVRGFGGLSSVSQYSKSVSSPHSYVQKTDTRVTNDFAHVQPHFAQTYAAPAAYAHQAYAPAAYAHQPYAPAAYAHQAYAPAPYAAAPVHHAAYAAAPVHHAAYAAAPVHHAAYAAAPVHHAAYAAAPVHHHYSGVSPAVATLTYNTPYASYSY